jgi:D-alanine-D-alanine ligase
MSDKEKDLTVGVLMGGVSSERAVSLRSGRAVYAALSKSGVRTVKIDPKRALDETLKKRPIDMAFLALHGKGGEDGSIQKELERRGIPFTGSCSRSSRRAFNKYRAKLIFGRLGIATPPWRAVRRSDYKRRLKDLRFPAFAKPFEDGSSIGIHRIDSYEAFIKKAKTVFGSHSGLLVEQAVIGRELTVGVLGEKTLPVIELRPNRTFYDYKAKYTAGETRYLCPAPIDEKTSRRARRLALKTHRALGLRDLSRIDMMMDKKGRLFVLEANTIPGFTELSLFPKAAGIVGMSFESLCRELLRLASRRAPRAKRY